MPCGEVKGVGVYRHGRDIGVNFSHKGALPEPASGAEELYDTTALQAGFITIVPIDGDYTAQGWENALPGGLFDAIEL